MSGRSSFHVPVCRLLMAMAAGLSASAHGEVQAAGLAPLTADEMSQVSAAGLPAQTVDGLVRHGALALAAEGVLQGARQDEQAALERQQAWAQLRLGGDNVRVGTPVMQAVAFTGQLTPLAPVLLPVMAFPFPLAMLPPPQSPKKQ